MIQVIRNINAKHWIFIFIAFLLVVSSSVSAQTIDRTTGKTLSQNKFNRQLNKKNTLLLNVRADTEFKAGHIPGAIQADVLKLENFKNQIADLDKNKTYLLYCKSGKRSSKAKFLMKEMGFKKLKDLKEGYSQWKGKKEVK